MPVTNTDGSHGDPRSNKNIPIPNTRPDYANGLSLFQHKWMKKICREKYKKSSIDGLVSVKAEINARVRDELAAKNTRSKTTLARLAGINSQATLSGEGRTILDPLAPSRTRSDSTTEVVSSISDIRRPRWDVRPSLGDLFDADKQFKSRWPGTIRLVEYKYDDTWKILLDVIDEALPMERKSGLGEATRAGSIHQITRGNFRILKSYLSECVRLACADGRQFITPDHFESARYALSL